jgi:hypothetical protein
MARLLSETSHIDHLTDDALAVGVRATGFAPSEHRHAKPRDANRVRLRSNFWLIRFQRRQIHTGVNWRLPLRRR